MSRHEERDFLLASLDDLDAEHEAGDLDDADYAALRDDYVARAAEVLRAEERGDPEASAPARGRSLARTAVWIVGIVALASLSGWWLARSVGARGQGTSLTGSGGTLRERLAECLPLSFQEPAWACYDKILADNPDNAEALTYKGWALVRQGKTDDGSKLFDRVLTVDPTYPDVHVFRAVVRKNAKDFAGAQTELDTLYSLNPPQGVLSTMSQMGLDTEVAFGLLSPTVQPCWQQAEDAAQELSRTQGSSGQSTSGATSKIEGAITCLSDVTAKEPDNLDALLASGYLLGIAHADVLYPQAKAALDHAVELAPRNATARLLRAALLNTMGDPSGALADLNALAPLGRTSPLFPIASPADIRKDVESQLSTTPTTTP